MRLLPILAFLVSCLAARAEFVPGALPPALAGYSEAARMRFGYITVPENRANPVRTIRLAVVVLPALSATPQPDPVFYIVGGPGGSGTLSSDGFPVFAALNRNRDIVFLDPRGAGFSEPNLHMRRNARTVGEFTSANRGFFQKRGIDLSAYNTTEIAQDYEAARTALGYTTINLFANSYGTFVAQELLRRYPATLRCAVLSGNSPATDSFLPTVLPVEKAAIDTLIRDVRRSPRARRAFPNFRTTFYRVVDRLNDKPVTLRVPTKGTSRTQRFVLDGAELLETISELLQRAETIRYVPLLVRELDQRRYGALVRRLLAQRNEKPRDRPFGMYLSVLGADFAAPGYVNATERGILSARQRTLIRTEGARIYQLSLLAVSWGVPYNPGTTRTLPQSSVRTLLLNGRMDAQTPVNGGAIIATGLPNAVNYVYPRIGHAVGFDNGPDMDAAVAFIENPAQAPAYSTGRLLRRDFYATRPPHARDRVLDGWRERLVDLPVGRLFERSAAGDEE